MSKKELRTYDTIKSKNIDLYLYLKTCFDNGQTYEEIRKDYITSLKNILKDEKLIKNKKTRLYHMYYSHFRNRELENIGINDLTIDHEIEKHNQKKNTT